MCLVIKNFPASTADALAVPCIKYLEKYSRGWRTPYQAAKMPKNGMLITAHPQWQMVLEPEFTIDIGAIHACTKERDIYLATQFTAYAFGVMAYDKNEDLCAKAVYIPELDFTAEKAKRLAACRRWQYNPNLTKATVLRVFPELEKHLDQF